MLNQRGQRDDHARGELVAAQPPVLNAEQKAAVAAVAGKLASEKFSVSLLHGVTGSGKTEVYLHAIDTVLKSGGGVAFLVPEVALTPQTVARLRARLEAIAPGNKCVVWHSHLSEGERLDGWLALATGEAADILMLDLDRLDRDAIMPVDPLDLLFARANQSHVAQLFVAGRQVIADGKLTGVDLAAIHTELRGRLRAGRREAGLQLPKPRVRRRGSRAHGRAG